MSKMIDIIFNGSPISIEETPTVNQFLHSQSIQAGRFLVVINDEIIPKPDYDTTTLASRDTVDIISPITGG